jgi:hypothetical protein
MSSGGQSSQSRPLRGTAGLRGLIIRAENENLRAGSERPKTSQEKRPHGSTASVADPRPKKAKPTASTSGPVQAHLHLMASQRTIQLSGGEGEGAKGGKCHLSWYHSEWTPVQEEDYGSSVTKESLKRLSSERAQMQCNHCDKCFPFNPSTRFRNHLLLRCSEFALTGTFQSGPVQADLKEEKDKLLKKNKVCLEEANFAFVRRFAHTELLS